MGAMVTIIVAVTQSDIDNGIRSDCWKCPIALALWRVTGWKWIVGGYSASYPESRGAYPIGHHDAMCELPESVWPVLPFEFKMQVPEWVMSGGKVKVEVLA